MKKTITAAIFLFALTASAAFGQTTAGEWYDKAGEYFKSGDYAGAITAYSEAIKRDSSNLDAYLFRGFAYYQTKNYDAAIADCNTVIKGAPDFPDAYIVRGDAYGAKGAYHTAAADYKTGLEKGSDPGGFNVDKSSKADMWFCGAMFMEITVNRFLGKPDAAAKYENWLKTVCDRNKLTRAEVEAFYRQNIGALIAEVVDEGFGKIHFMIDRKYNTILKYNPKANQYILEYEQPSIENDDKKITATSLDDLRAKMTASRDFTADGITLAVNEKAGYIPAVVYANWQIGIANGVNGLALVKETITNFYLNLTQNNYRALLGIFSRYASLTSSVQDPFAEAADWSLSRTMSTLNHSVYSKIVDDLAHSDIRALARIPADSRYNVFSIPAGGGGGGPKR